MLDRISLGRFLCLSGLLWLLYGLNGAWYGVRLGFSVLSSCTVKTLSNLEMPYTVMVPTIALYHSGVRAVVSPVSFYISPSLVCLCSFLPYFRLIGCCDHAYKSPHLQVSLSLACYNVDRFVASSLFASVCIWNHMLLCFIYFDGAEMKDTTTTNTKKSNRNFSC